VAKICRFCRRLLLAYWFRWITPPAGATRPVINILGVGRRKAPCISLLRAPTTTSHVRCFRLACLRGTGGRTLLLSLLRMELATCAWGSLFCLTPGALLFTWPVIKLKRAFAVRAKLAHPKLTLPWASSLSVASLRADVTMLVAVIGNSRVERWEWPRWVRHSGAWPCGSAASITCNNPHGLTHHGRGAGRLSSAPRLRRSGARHPTSGLGKLSAAQRWIHTSAYLCNRGIHESVLAPLPRLAVPYPRIDGQRHLHVMEQAEHGAGLFHLHGS
jgi:hypothetical protein